MNPYYQIPEGPKRGRRGLVVAAVVAVAIVVMLLVIVLLSLPSDKPDPVPPDVDDPAMDSWAGETRANTSAETRWESSESVLPPVPTETETAPDQEPGLVTEHVTEMISETEPETEPPLPIQYIPYPAVYAWQEDVKLGLDVIKGQREGQFETGIHRVGLFDFEMDGWPEIVVQHEKPNGDVDMDIYSLKGELIKSFSYQSWTGIYLYQYASAGEAYPAVTILETRRTYGGLNTKHENYTYFIDKVADEPRLAFGDVLKNGTQYYYGPDGEKDSTEEHGEITRAFRAAYTRLDRTELKVYQWTADADIAAFAKSIVNNATQRYVMPQAEAYPTE